MGAQLDSLHIPLTLTDRFPLLAQPQVLCSSHRCLVSISYDRAFYHGAPAQQQIVLVLPRRDPKQRNLWAFISLQSVYLFQWWFWVWSLLVPHLLPQSPWVMDQPAPKVPIPSTVQRVGHGSLIRLQPFTSIQGTTCNLHCSCSLSSLHWV